MEACGRLLLKLARGERGGVWCLRIGVRDGVFLGNGIVSEMVNILKKFVVFFLLEIRFFLSPIPAL